MATYAEHHAQAEQLLDPGPRERADRRPAEESDALRAEAAIHASLAVGAALRESAASATATTTAAVTPRTA